MSKAYAAIGTQLWIGDGGSPEMFFRVARIGDVAGPKSKVDTIDVTTHESALQAAPYKEYIASLMDGQEVTFPLVWDPGDDTHSETATSVGTNAGGLKYLMEQRAIRNMRLAYPTSPATRTRFVGFVTGYEPDLKVTGHMAANVTIKVTGKPTLEAGTGPGA